MILMTLSLISIAQNNPEKTNKQQLLEKIEAQRSAYITSKLDMTSEESAKFWPLYNEYSRKRMELKKENKAQNTDNLSEQESRMELDEQIESQEKALALKKSYYEKFKAVLPAAKLAKLESAEQEFRREILRQIKESLDSYRHLLLNQKTLTLNEQSQTVKRKLFLEVIIE